MQSWLSAISWSDYFMGIGWIAGGYYVVVLGVYYHRDLVRLLAGKRSGAVTVSKSADVPPAKSSGTALRPGLPDTDLHRVHDLMEELKTVFAQKEALLEKADLLARLQTLLQGYTRLLGSGFEAAILHHIILESNEQCGMALHAEEIKAAWMNRS